MNRRFLLMGMLLIALAQVAGPAHAESGSGGGGGGGNSGNGGGGGGNDDDHDEDEGDDDWDDASDAAERGDIASLPDVLRIALSNAPGKVIAVKLKRRGASYVYRVKILTKTGRKIELAIDARSRIVTRVK
jgi:hypothetical protein